MTDRERFNAIMNYQPVDRMPAYYFGTWSETLTRWRSEGLTAKGNDDITNDDITVATGMDPDWESGMWNVHGIINIHAIVPGQSEVLEESDTYRIVKLSTGAVEKQSKIGASIPQHLVEALQPTRESWNRFKTFLNPEDPARYPPDWKARAKALNQRDRVTACFGGSLFGWPREWLGIEAISYLAYDDPGLYEEIIEYLSEYFMQLLAPVMKMTKFDFAYFFEDCCFKSGPLFSPATCKKYYHKYYRKLIDFYRAMGVRHILIDSDGKVDDLIPCWMESGFDILFPIEVGTWRANPVILRQQYGKALRMIGGVDKHVIPLGEKAIREHLKPLKELASEGGFIPLPDHRIPPDCSLKAFRTYIRVFKETF
ncbi:MAG: uroporphyrinogen decarboxylase family protein [Kiritimatiellia bacterium]|nr:uroporphyrinogen decarboxylase family protein [Kiritimatiellia bacterium]